VVTVFNFAGATRKDNTKYQTNSAQVSYKLSQKLYFLTMSDCKTATVWFMNEAVPSSVKKIASEGWDFRKVELFRSVKSKEIKTYTHH